MFGFLLHDDQSFVAQNVKGSHVVTSQFNIEQLGQTNSFALNVADYN